MLRPGVCVGLICLGSSTPVEAANRRSFFFGSEAASTGGALIASAAGTDALFYNPAGLAQSGSTRLNLSLTAFTLRLTPTPDGFQVLLPSGRRSADVDVSELLPNPSALVYTRPLNARWSYGVGIFVVERSDVRFDTRIDAQSVPSSDGEVNVTTAFRGQAVRRKYNIGVGLAYRESDRFRVGGALFAVYDRRVDAQSYFSAATSEAVGSFLATVDSDIKSVALLPTVGFQWDLEHSWHLGLTIRGPTLSLYSWGDRAPLVSNSNGGQTGFLGARDEISEFNIQVVDPSAFELMVVKAVGDRWRLGATLEIVTPIEQGGIIPLSVEVLVNARVGAEVQLPDGLRLGFGFYTDLADTDRVESPRETRINYFGTTAGVSFDRPLDADENVVFTSTFAVGYLLGVGRVGSLLLDPLGSPQDVSTEAESTLVHELALNIATGLVF